MNAGHCHSASVEATAAYGGPITQPEDPSRQAWGVVCTLGDSDRPAPSESTGEFYAHTAGTSVLSAGGVAARVLTQPYWVQLGSTLLASPLPLGTTRRLFFLESIMIIYRLRNTLKSRQSTQLIHRSRAGSTSSEVAKLWFYAVHWSYSR